MKYHSERGEAITGAIVLVVFLSIAGFAFWIGTAPVIELEEYPTDFSKDPGSISVEGISAGDILPQKFSFLGEADNAWFYESSMPAEIRSRDGTLLWEGQANVSDYSKETWLFVVEADVGNYTGPAEIILIRDNETDDPTYDKEYRIQVIITDDSDVPAPGE